MWRDPLTTINQGSGCRCQLHRRDLKGLSECDRRQFHLPDIFLFVHDRPRLSRQIDTGLFQQTEFFKIRIIFFHSQPQRHIDKYRVARIFYPLHKSLGSVSGSSRTVDPPVFHHPESRTGKLILQCHHTGFQTCGCCDDLKGGTRFVGIVDTGISPHPV